MIIREIKKNPFVASQNVANTLDLNIAARTVGDRALKARLRSRIVEKKPYKNILVTVMLPFAKDEMFTVWIF